MKEQKFDLQDFDVSLSINAKDATQATKAVLALQKLFSVIDAETICKMQEAVEKKNSMAMIGIATKLISGKN